jgi:DNA polymerase-3 subunit gamma/tau
MSVGNYIVLSRKYRPKSLDDLVGQDVLASILKNCIDSGKVPHAFLFHGIRGIGKTTTARILARCLNCMGRDGVTSNPCGECASCRALDIDNHLDVMEIDAASRTGVDDIREIIDSSQYAPVTGRYKIFIIDEVHMLSKSAFNALLKTLEEPPNHVKFIFATTEIQKIPETILSRCMTFNLKPISVDVIEAHILKIANLENFKIDKEAANTIAIESEGSLRDSLSLLEQAVMLANDSPITNDIVVQMIGGAKDSDIKELLDLILSAKTREALEKSCALLKNGADAYVVYKSLQTELYRKIVEAAGGKANNLSNLLYLWQIFLRQMENIKMASYPEQVLNASIIIMSHTSSFQDISKLIIKDDKDHKEEPIPEKLLEVNDMEEQGDTSGGDAGGLVQEILNRFPGSTVTELL